MNAPYRKILCFLGSSLCFLTSFAQSSKIQGIIENINTHEPLPYTNVVLLNANDSTLVKGTLSDDQGDFAISKVPAGKYILTVSSVGFEKYTSQTIETNGSKKTYDMGKISLEPASINLDGVEIVARRPFIEREAGKTIVNVESAPAGAGDNVWELLKKVPGVTIENDSEIKLNGISGVTILIDDRKTYLSGDALIAMLKNMPTLNVDQVETITNPSEKYDAEGVGGILNIKLKKNNNLGVFGSVYASAGYSNTFLHSEGIDLSMRLKKWAVFGGASNNHWAQKGNGKSWLTYPDGTVFEGNTGENDLQDPSFSYNSGGQSYKLGADYYFNNKNIIGFIWRMSNNNFTSEQFQYMRIKRNEITDSSYSALYNTESKNSYNMFNLNFKHVFDSAKSSEIVFDFDYSFNTTNEQSLQPINSYLGDFSSLVRNEETDEYDDSKVSIFSFKTDFEHSFSKKLRFNAGGKMSFVTDDNIMDSYLNGNNDIERSNRFIYKENIGAVYAGLSVLFSEQTNMRIGLRGEYTFTEGFLENLDTTNHQNYFDLFPNITFRQQLGKSNELEFSYRYQIQRPNYSSLNPFVYRGNKYSYYSGNPDLKPQYAHNLSLMHALKHMLFTTVGYAYSDGQPVYLVEFDPTRFIRFQKPENLGKSQSIYVSMSGNIPIFKWWFCSVYGRMGWGFSEINYSDSLVKNNTFNSQISIGQYFTITPNLTAEISGWFTPQSTGTDFSTRKAVYSINAGIRQKLFKDRLSIRLSVNNIFNTSNWESEYRYPTGITSKYESKSQNRSFWLSLSYNFGKQDIVLRQRKTASEEEQGRMGGGGNMGK